MNLAQNIGNEKNKMAVGEAKSNIEAIENQIKQTKEIDLRKQCLLFRLMYPDLEYPLSFKCLNLKNHRSWLSVLTHLLSYIIVIS